MGRIVNCLPGRLPAPWPLIQPLPLSWAQAAQTVSLLSLSLSLTHTLAHPIHS